jgi:hypothetical protein
VRGGDATVTVVDSLRDEINVEGGGIVGGAPAVRSIIVVDR